MIELQTELAPNRCRTSWARNSEIRDALTNLIFNAVDAMPDGGTLTVRTAHGAPSRDGATRRVDRGDATPASAWTRTRGAAASSRSSPPRASAAPGSGLAMVYGMVQRHSAEIEIDSAVGDGHHGAPDFPGLHLVRHCDAAQPGAPVVQRRLRILLGRRRSAADQVAARHARRRTAI